MARPTSDLQVDLSAYRNPALQFSGGKDSLALLYLLQDQLDRLTVYWVDTGDGCPETLSVIEQVKPWIPRFVRVRTDVHVFREQHGLPTDLVPASGHLIGVAYGMGQQRYVGRFDCCAHNLMMPMHRRMVDDGVDAVIRGTKRADTGRVPFIGPAEHYDVLLPLLEWTHDDVFDYLARCGAPLNPIYEHFGDISAPECMGCTAWWGDNKAQYLQARHPHLYGRHVEQLRGIRIAVAAELERLDQEIGG